MSTEVSLAPAGDRYDITVDGTPAGYTAVRVEGPVAVMPHTEIEPSFEGHGLGSTLIAGALDDIRKRGLRVDPVCPFVSRFIEEHAEYQDLRG